MDGKGIGDSLKVAFWFFGGVTLLAIVGAFFLGKACGG